MVCVVHRRERYVSYSHLGVDQRVPQLPNDGYCRGGSRAWVEKRPPLFLLTGAESLVVGGSYRVALMDVFAFSPKFGEVNDDFSVCGCGLSS